MSEAGLMSKPSTLLRRVDPSVTGGIRDRIKELKFQGQSVLRLDAGEVAFPPPALEVAFHDRDPDFTDPYGHPLGRPQLRQAVVDHRGAAIPAGLDADSVLITSGAKQAVFLALSVLGGPGCDVLIPAPYWVSYPPMLQLTGGQAIIVPTTHSSSFKVTPESLEGAVTANTTALVLNSPSNPTGATYSLDELSAIASWAHLRGIWVISDEIYRQIHFDSKGPAPSLADVPGATDYVVIDGLSKAYALAGWRVGWLIAPKHVLEPAKSVMSHTTSHASNFPQLVAQHALQDTDYVSRVRSELSQRRDVLYSALTDAGLNCVKPSGSIYTFPSIEPLIGRTFGSITVTDDLTAADALLSAAGIASVPGSAFGVPNHLRLGYGQPIEELKAAGAKLVDLLA